MAEELQSKHIFKKLFQQWKNNLAYLLKQKYKLGNLKLNEGVLETGEKTP